MSALLCVFQDLSKQTDLPERAIQIWFRRRKLKDAPTPLQKFRESRYCKENALTLSLFIYLLQLLRQIDSCFLELYSLHERFHMRPSKRNTSPT